jgi:hypothetical protein
MAQEAEREMIDAEPGTEDGARGGGMSGPSARAVIKPLPSF